MTFEELGIDTRGKTGRYATTCPNCNDTRTKHRNALCLTVNDVPDNRWFHCNHPPCGWSGNLDAMDKYKKVQENSKMPDQQREFSLKMRECLKSRGISIKTAKQAKLYESTHNRQTVLSFPYFLSLTLVNVKFLNIDWKKGVSKGPKWWQLKKEYGTRIIPFLISQIRTRDENGNRIKNCIVIITEGEWDALTWIECGYINIISVPMGAPSLNSKEFKKEFDYLRDPYVKSVLDEVDHFVLSVDNDQAGLNLRHHLSMILGKEKCRYINYPKGYKDINEVFNGDKIKNLTALGKDGVDKCYKQLRAVPIKGIIKPGDVYSELEILRNDGFLPGLGCGVPEIDRLFTVKPKHISFVTGVPGSGKSTWVRWWAATMVRHNKDLNLKWALFTPENRPVSREFAKLAQVITGQFIQKDDPNGMNDDTYQNAMRYIRDHFFIISPDRINYESFGGQVQANKVNTILSLQHYLMYLKKTENIFGFIIDAWNKIEHEQPRHQSETSFISEQLDRLIDFCDFWDMHGIVVVHPRKVESIRDGNYKMPTLYDIKGSSAFKEKADIGIILHRYKYRAKLAEELRGDEDEDEKLKEIEDAATIIRTEKIRFEETGNESRARMYMRKTGVFYIADGQSSKIEIPDADKRIESSKEDDDILLF